MQIIIKRLDGEKKPYDVEPGQTAGKLKEMLSEKMGISVPQLRLVFKGSPMDDVKTLGDQKVAAGDTIHIILQITGGAKRQ